MERVGDAERGERVLVVAGVAHERPAGAVGLAEEVRQIARAGEACFALRARSFSANSGAESNSEKYVASTLWW